MNDFFQNYGEKIGLILMEILGAIWVYYRTKKKLTPEEKEAAKIKKQEKKCAADVQRLKKDNEKLEALKNASN